MPTADGSIVVKIDADDKAAERKLKSLQNQIDRLEDKIYKTQAKRSPVSYTHLAIVRKMTSGGLSQE